MCVYTGAYEGPELELQVVLSQPTWMLEIKLRHTREQHAVTTTETSLQSLELPF